MKIVHVFYSVPTPTYVSIEHPVYLLGVLLLALVLHGGEAGIAEELRVDLWGETGAGVEGRGVRGQRSRAATAESGWAGEGKGASSMPQIARATR